MEGGVGWLAVTQRCMRGRDKRGLYGGEAGREAAGSGRRFWETVLTLEAPQFEDFEDDGR